MKVKVNFFCFFSNLFLFTLKYFSWLADNNSGLTDTNAVKQALYGDWGLFQEYPQGTNGSTLLSRLTAIGFFIANRWASSVCAESNVRQRSGGIHLVSFETYVQCFQNPGFYECHPFCYAQ